MGAHDDDWQDGWDVLDAAVTRLEEYLSVLPFDRVLPDLSVVLHGADITMDVLREDERARKLLHEAIRARPLATEDAVRQRATEVELLTLEVGVLMQQRAAGTAPDADEVTRGEAQRATERLGWIRARLAELRKLL